jgi:hypothetical protein
MNDRKLHDFLKEAQGAITASLARAPATLFFLATAAAMPIQDAKAWTTQYENIGRQVGREVGRSAGSSDSARRLGDLIGGVMGGAITRPLDESARASEMAKREEERAKREQERLNSNNQRRLDQAAMAGREKAIREQAYQQQIEQGRSNRHNSGGVASSYPNVAREAQASMDQYADVQRATSPSSGHGGQYPREDQR